MHKELPLKMKYMPKTCMIDIWVPHNQLQDFREVSKKHSEGLKTHRVIVFNPLYKPGYSRIKIKDESLQFFEIGNPILTDIVKSYYDDSTSDVFANYNDQTFQFTSNKKENYQAFFNSLMLHTMNHNDIRDIDDILGYGGNGFYVRKYNRILEASADSIAVNTSPRKTVTDHIADTIKRSFNEYSKDPERFLELKIPYKDD